MLLRLDVVVHLARRNGDEGIRQIQCWVLAFLHGPNLMEALATDAPRQMGMELAREHISMPCTGFIEVHAHLASRSCEGKKGWRTGHTSILGSCLQKSRSTMVGRAAMIHDDTCR